ncbi:uncharacterized protein MONOS_16935 [Monocercomonoides exilis]|uniref:uncharacterized protein n=1 Tax=Monocercomonoides exilis TaxID=2049356 RepID=UPI00355AB07A|nr:hypothetical protein MONOS_16935 [Monocercomonoides exilis]
MCDVNTRAAVIVRKLLSEITASNSNEHASLLRTIHSSIETLPIQTLTFLCNDVFFGHLLRIGKSSLSNAQTCLEFLNVIEELAYRGAVSVSVTNVNRFGNLSFISGITTFLKESFLKNKKFVKNNYDVFERRSVKEQFAATLAYSMMMKCSSLKEKTLNNISQALLPFLKRCTEDCTRRFYFEKICVAFSCIFSQLDSNVEFNKKELEDFMISIVSKSIFESSIPLFYVFLALCGMKSWKKNEILQLHNKFDIMKVFVDLFDEVKDTYFESNCINEKTTKEKKLQIYNLNIAKQEQQRNIVENALQVLSMLVNEKEEISSIFVSDKALVSHVIDLTSSPTRIYRQFSILTIQQVFEIAVAKDIEKLMKIGGLMAILSRFTSKDECDKGVLRDACDALGRLFERLRNIITEDTCSKLWEQLLYEGFEMLEDYGFFDVLLSFVCHQDWNVSNKTIALFNVLKLL